MDDEDPLAWPRRRRDTAPAQAAGAWAFVDTVTGLGNQQALTATLADTIAAGRPSALLLVEIDGFRALALRLGDDQGHGLLRRLGQQLGHLGDDVCSFRLVESVFAVVPRATSDPSALAERLADDMTSVAGQATASVATPASSPGCPHTCSRSAPAAPCTPPNDGVACRWSTTPSSKTGRSYP